MFSYDHAPGVFVRSFMQVLSSAAPSIEHELLIIYDQFSQTEFCMTGNECSFLIATDDQCYQTVLTNVQ